MKTRIWIQLGAAIVLHGVAALLVGVALLFVVPGITPLFEDMGATLPVLTRLTITLSYTATDLWFLSIPATGMIAVAHLAVLILLARREGQFPFWTYALLVLAGLSILSITLFGSMYLPIFRLA